MATNFSYRDLRIWQEAVDLALVIYRATAEFPKHELYGLTSQMRRAAVSISSNIAEGKGHSSDGDFGRFLFHARGSLLELQTQIVIARGLEYLTKEQAAELTRSTDDLGRGLNGLIQAVREKRGPSRTAANSEQRTTNSGTTDHV
jgi:four helix bundle protein